MDQPPEPLNLEELGWARHGLYSHGEVMGLDRHGRVVAWSVRGGEPYLTGAALPEIDISDLGVLERERISRDSYVLDRPFDYEQNATGPSF